MIWFSSMSNKLDRVIDLLEEVRAAQVHQSHLTRHLGRTAMADLAELEAAVSANGEVQASAITLIEGLADRLDNIDPSDTIELNALADELRQQSANLAAAVTSNTPAESGTPPTETTPPTDTTPPDTTGGPVDPGDQPEATPFQ